MKDNDKEFIHMLDNIKELQFDTVQEWLGENKFRVEALAAALARDEIIYTMSVFTHNDLHEGKPNKLMVEDPEEDRDYPYKNYIYNDVQGYSRVLWFKNLFCDFPEHFRLRLDAPSFKKWLNKAFQLEPAPHFDTDFVSISEQEFNSKELSIARECSRALYPENPGTKANEESEDIRDWLEHNYPELSGAAVTRISQVINPGVKPSGK